ncbi:MAG: ABC transporter permease [Chloroflexi bacterium]|nr:ABC transporter permease [Chloroflexota bacterium]
MPDILTAGFLTALIGGGLAAGVPLIFASLGEIIAEESGVLNVGLEGMMLSGAFVGFLATLAFGNLWLGLGAGAVAGLLVSLVMVVFCIRLGLDQIVVGVAIVLTAEGATAVLHSTMFGDSYPRLDAAPTFDIPVLSDIPIVGGSLFSQPLPVYLGLVLVGIVAWLLRRSSPGLHLRAAGELPASLDAAGVDVVRVRTVAELACGALAGLGGAYLVIVGAGTFVPFVTHGAGFIAIVIAMLARGRAWWSVAGAFLFGMSLSLTTALQLVGIAVPIDVVQMLPFVSVLLVLIIFARDARLPSALGLPYLRGSR